jgi:hypothetical protein
MKVRTVLAVGLTLVAIAVALVLSGSPARVLGTNSALTRAVIASVDGSASICQADGVLPRGTSALRLSLNAGIGPSVTVTVLANGRTLARGTRGSGWTGADVTVPVAVVASRTPRTTLCFSLGQSRQPVALFGEPEPPSAAASSAGQRLAGRIEVEYMATGDTSWWASAEAVARRIGLGRAPSGSWVVLLLLSLMAAVAMLASFLSVRELEAVGRAHKRAQTASTRPRSRLFSPCTRLLRPLRDLPAAAWICALVACLNAVCWSLLSPPFQTPDEPSHFAYVQLLAETQRLPTGATGQFSLEELVAMAGLRQPYVHFRPGIGTISSRAQELRLEHDLRLPLSRVGPGDAGVAASEPPLYYALETIPYELGSGGTLLDQLELMRLLTAVFGGLAAMFAFLFVREALPNVPWAWTVGGLGVALTPLLGFVSGAVNPEAPLTTVTAALFYLLVRAFRRGLTPALGAAIGAMIAVGLLTKLNFLGLAPGALVGVIVVALRAPSSSRRSSYAALALAVAVAASPALLYIAAESLVNHRSLSVASGVASSAQRGGSLVAAASYIWQLYLPRLPGMTSYFPGVLMSRQVWFDGLVGLYGWADTVFPSWVYEAALVPAGLLALLCLRTLVARRETLRRRLPELAVYATMVVGLLALVGAISYVSDVLENRGAFWEPRYLLPLIPLFGLALALAARGAGRRWGPAVGAMIIVLVLAHDIFSQLLVVSRYYG